MRLLQAWSCFSCFSLEFCGPSSQPRASSTRPALKTHPGLRPGGVPVFPVDLSFGFLVPLHRDGGDKSPRSIQSCHRPHPTPSPSEAPGFCPLVWDTPLPVHFPVPSCLPGGSSPSSPTRVGLGSPHRQDQGPHTGRIRVPGAIRALQEQPLLRPGSPERILQRELHPCGNVPPQGGSPSEAPRVPRGTGSGTLLVSGSLGWQGWAAASGAEFGARCVRIYGNRGKISQGHPPAVFWEGLGRTHLLWLGLG